MHVIRLRAPWRVEPVAPDAGGCAGVRHARHFNCPTGLTPQDRVWLVVAVGPAQAWLNGESLGDLSDGPAEFDVTPLLALHNEIWLDRTAQAGSATAPPAYGTAAAEVRLEIRTAADRAPS